eukprot:TRINITY_DN878_c0_g3_i1.p2 TRINITY_DN878_c0_g3~~TRINITY_DN878_c0_g3_i1.p2  ORF type:complete len:134 (-),score=21.52 TRINITY_DN878_c0_g3_i1:825-1226(-)
MTAQLVQTTLTEEGYLPSTPGYRLLKRNDLWTTEFKEVGEEVLPFLRESDVVLVQCTELPSPWSRKELRHRVCSLIRNGMPCCNIPAAPQYSSNNPRLRQKDMLVGRGTVGIVFSCAHWGSLSPPAKVALPTC